MKINELLVERQELDELNMAQVGKAIGQGATAVGKGIGATASGAVQTGKNFWQGLKTGWSAGQKAVAGDTDGDGTPDAGGAPASGGGAPAGVAPAAQTGGGTAALAPAAQTGGGAAEVPAQGAAPDELEQIKGLVAKLSPEQKKQISSELEKSTSEPAVDPNKQSADATARGQQNKGFGFNNQTGVAFNSQAEKDAFKAQQAQAGAAPAAQQPATGGIDTAQMKADRDAKNAADAAERDKQIAATKAANAQAAQADNELVAAVKAAKAIPAFQQTAQDKLTIKRGAEKGIHESKKKKKKKAVAEFKSNFLGIII